MALTDNLIAYWELEEASGTRNDAHSTNHLTDHSVGQAAGKVGNGADFELGNSSWLSCADNAALSTGNIDFSMCAWVKLESKPASRMTIMGKIDSGSLEYDLTWSNGLDRFELRICSGGGFANLDNQPANSLGAPSLATWYFIVAWHDAAANTINIQVNNGTADSKAYTFGSYDSGIDFKMGGETDFLGYFDGVIDQVGFWKKVLTTQDKTDLYNSNNGLSYAALSGGGTTPKTATFTDSLAGGEIL